MKNFLLTIVASLVVGTSFSQAILIQQPGASVGVDAGVNSYSSNTDDNYATYGVSASYYWSNAFESYFQETYFKFDLSSIPPNAIIVNATLDLVSENPTNTFNNSPSTPNNGTDNGAIAKMVLADWEENTITWNNRPASSSSIADTMPKTLNATSNITVLLTKVVQEIVRTGINFGFVISTAASQPNNSLVYRTSDYPGQANWPKLSVYWNFPTSLEDNMQSNFILSPNPFDDFVVVSGPISSSVEYEVVSLMGQILKKGVSYAQENNQFFIRDLEALPNGNYVLKIRNEAGEVYRKLTKVK